MKLDELRDQVNRVKNDLGGILGTYRISETEVYFVNRKDIEFIEELIKEVDSHCQEQLKEVNTNTIESDEMEPYTISVENKKILDRIVEHAEKYKEGGVVKYKIQDDYMLSVEVQEAIKEYLNSKFLNKFLTESNFNFLKTIPPYLDNNNNLSAKQTIIVESIFDKVDEKREKEKAGIIYFNPSGDPTITDMGNRLINCALGRGRKQNTVSGDDVIEAKEMYFREVEVGQLDEFREILRIEMKVKTNYRTFSQYEPVIKLLEKYMAAINSDFYIIDGLRSATPKHLVQQD